MTLRLFCNTVWWRVGSNDQQLGLSSGCAVTLHSTTPFSLKIVSSLSQQDLHHQWPTTPFILRQPVLQCHLGAPPRHLHCLLCALIGRVAGSQWLDCQMTSKKGFKLVETAGHCAQPSHQLVYGRQAFMEVISRKHTAISLFVRFKAFVPAQNDHQRQIRPPLLARFGRATKSMVSNLKLFYTNISF